MNLQKHIQTTECKDIQNVILVAAEASIKIYDALKHEKFAYAKSSNSSGETQLSHDLIADKILKEALQNSGSVSCFVSEERETEVCFVDHKPEKLLVAFDPIDGSSVAGLDQAVGTSLGIYRGVNQFTDARGRDQVASVYMMYGPRILLVYSTGNGVHVFTYNENSQEFLLEKENLTLDVDKKICGFGGMQHSCSIAGFPDLIRYWEKEGFSLRYSGSMTADTNGILLRGGGIFLYPSPKLRMLYECNPFAFLVEQAGGKATDLKGVPILDKHITAIDEASPIILGKKDQVDKALEYFNDTDKQKGCYI